jgi:hypothetical protein
MSDEYRKLGHPTRPRVPKVNADEDPREAVTKVKCPACQGCGMVPADVAAVLDRAFAMMTDDQ